MPENIGLKLYETRTISTKQGLAGSDVAPFYIISGSRLLLSFQVDSLSSGASVLFEVDNGFDSAGPWSTLSSVSMNAASLEKRVFSDFHGSFQIRVTVTGGTASYRIGASAFDNSSSTKIENATIDVNLNSLPDAEGRYDSVRIGDADGDELDINPDGSISVASPGEVKNIFNDIASLAASGSATVVSYTVPPGKVFYLASIEYGGNNIATFQAVVDSDTFAKRRTWFGTDMSGEFDFRNYGKRGLMFEAGQEIKLVVDNFRPSAGDFEGRIFGVEDDAA